jgi:hypothetical protein
LAKVGVVGSVLAKVVGGVLANVVVVVVGGVLAKVVGVVVVGVLANIVGGIEAHYGGVQHKSCVSLTRWTF